MQYYNIIKNITGSWVFGLLLSSAGTAYAEENMWQSMPDYSFHMAESQSNPWAVPQVEDESKYMQFPQHRNQGAPAVKHRAFRFVTPEILESLKQQQMMYQRLPGSAQQGYMQRNRKPPYQSRPRQIMPAPSPPVPGASMFDSPLQGFYGYPPGGMSYSNPMVDVPSVSPWGSGSDLLQRGGTFPWLPDAAVGGLPPIHVQPFIDNEGWGGSNNNVQPFDDNEGWGDNGNNAQDNGFNPFSFGPNGNL